MTYKAVIFDFDLTLADSSKGILICFKHTLDAFGYAVPDDRTIYNTIGLTLMDAFDILTGIKNNPKREEMRAEYVKKADDEMVKNTLFYDGVIDMLKEFRDNGIRVGVCSTKYRYRIEQSFERQAGCMPIDLIIGGEDVKNAKPDPQGLLLCIEKLGLKKGDVLYVGDNIVDAQAAERAGVDFAAVLTGSTTKSEFSSLPNRAVVDKLTDITALVYKE